MSTRASAAIVAATLVGILFAPLIVDAQTARSGGAANAELMQQLQQLASARTSLEADNARLKQQLADVTKQRDDLKRSQQALEQRSRASASALEESGRQRGATDQELEQLKGKMQQLIAKFRETIQTLRDTETQRSTAQQELGGRERELKTCIDHNAALYKIDGEVLTHLEHDSVWAHLVRAEPFTKIERAQLENLVDDYKARAEDEHLKPAAPAGGQAPAPPAQVTPQPPASAEPNPSPPSPPPRDGAGSY